MRAAVVTDFRSPLQVQDLPIPEPGAGEVLVRIETSGLCHTDIHAAHGDWPVKPTPPFIPGHEGVGYVEKLGTGVSTRAIGDRVAIAWLGYACGECRYCNGGWETLCEKQQNSGYSVNGTFAEYAVVPAAFAAPVPDGVSSRDAAPLTCAGVTTYKAIKVARVAPAETVAIFGVGGLGHLALQYARIAGGFVIAVDIEDHKLTMATELGADHVVNALTTDPVEAIQALGGADVAVALAASPGAFDQAYRSLRRGGRLVCVALPADNATLSLPIFNTVINGKTVIGSIVGTRNDLADVFALHAAGRTTVIAVDRKIDEVNQSIERRPRRHRPGPCRLPVLITQALGAARSGAHRGWDHDVGPARHRDHAVRVAARDHHAGAGGEGQPVTAAPAQRAGDRAVGNPAGGVDAADPADHIPGPAVWPAAGDGPRAACPADGERAGGGGNNRAMGRTVTAAAWLGVLQVRSRRGVAGSLTCRTRPPSAGGL